MASLSMLDITVKCLFRLNFQHIIFTHQESKWKLKWKLASVMQNRRRYKSYAWTHPKTKKLYARVRIRQADGTLKAYLKPAINLKHADQLAGEMLDDYAVRKTGFIEGEAMTFSQLADWYKKTHSIPPVYSDDGSKVAGIRTFETEKRRIDKLKEFFGKVLIKNIDEEILRRYKIKREKDKVSPATINRDFEILRAMFRKAIRRRWLRESPFDFGEKLIEKALEKRRERILTDEEETAILLAAKQSEKTLLYYVILCLLDTGARPSEIYDASTVKAEPIVWSDFFDCDFKAVKLTSYKGRKKLIRFAPVSKRLEQAMMSLWNSIEEETRDAKAQIFPIASFKTAWGKARLKADLALKITKKLKLPAAAFFDGTISDEQIKELENEMKGSKLDLDVRLRDLRRNFRTKLSRAGMNDSLVQKMMGHENLDTTFDYLQSDLQAVYLANDAINKQNESAVIIESDGVN